jgi:hypothetical protein
LSREILQSVGNRESVRRTLSHGGVLALDPGLPFLLMHRQDDGGIARLIAGEASFLASRRDEEGEARELVRRIAEAGSSAFGAFLILELWAAADAHARTFRLRAPAGPAPEPTEKLAETLRP